MVGLFLYGCFILMRMQFQTISYIWGAFCLLPTACSLALLAFHLTCVWLKAADEEAYLLTTHGEDYRAHIARTGRLFPKL